MELKEMQEKAKKSLADGRSIIEAWEKEHKDEPLSEEKQKEVDGHFDEAERWAARARTEQREAEVKAVLDKPQRKHPLADPEDAERGAGGHEETAEVKALKALRCKAFESSIRKKWGSLSDIERKALSSLRDPDGGVFATPEFRSELLRKLRDMVQIRARATVIRTSRQQVGFPTMDFDGDVPVMEPEEDYSIIDISDWLGKQMFTPHKRGGIWKLPEELLEDSEVDVEALLTDHFSMRFSEIEESDFLNGDGVTKPFGILQANLNGRPVNSGATVTAEDVIDVIYDLRAVHRNSPGIAWMMHRNTVRQVRKLRDKSGGANTGQFLWQPGLQAGQPASLAGYPLLESEFFPDHNTGGSTGDPLILFGNLREYWIVDRTDLTVRRLDEKYADEDKVGIRIRKRTDAAPVRRDAFTRLNHA